MSTEDLEERVEEIEALLEHIEFRGVDDPTDADIDDIWIAGYPVGKMLDEHSRQLSSVRSGLDTSKDGLQDALAALADDDVSSSPVVDDENLLPIHRMKFELEHNGGEALSETPRRAARLFGDFIRNADAVQGKYVYSSNKAKDCLASAGDPGDPRSKQVTRALEAVENFAKREFDHDSLLRLEKRRGTNHLVADAGPWEAYCQDVQRRIEESSAAITDDDADAPSASEDHGDDREETTDETTPEAVAADARDRLNDLEAAEVSDNVVSNGNGALSDGGDRDTPR